MTLQIHPESADGTAMTVAIVGSVGLLVVLGLALSGHRDPDNERPLIRRR
jgi:hypothetical protein